MGLVTRAGLTQEQQPPENFARVDYFLIQDSPGYQGMLDTGTATCTTELSLQDLQSLSHLRYPMDTRQLTSPQGEADGVSDGGMTLQALGGVNSPCN
jgi:hypothetical protein